MKAKTAGRCPGLVTHATSWLSRARLPAGDRMRFILLCLYPCIRAHQCHPWFILPSFVFWLRPTAAPGLCGCNRTLSMTRLLAFTVRLFAAVEIEPPFDVAGKLLFAAGPGSVRRATGFRLRPLEIARLGVGRRQSVQRRRTC
jgi:hypothetical protein